MKIEIEIETYEIKHVEMSEEQFNELYSLDESDRCDYLYENFGVYISTLNLTGLYCSKANQ